MSMQLCPSCLNRQFDAGRCGNCGFTAAEYKPARTALPLGSTAGSYRFGVMKTNSRQSQIYTAAQAETSAPVIIEEFFPAKVVGRKPGAEEVSPASADEEALRRFEQGCQLIESSAQKRPLKRLETFRANNTIYSVFEPAPTMNPAAQCEMLADNPYYFRDQNGKPSMTINALPIPPMPSERRYNASQIQDHPLFAPVSQTQAADNEELKPVRQRPRWLIPVIAGVAALLVIVIALLLILPPPPPPPPPETPTPEVLVTPTPTATPTPAPTATPTPTPVPVHETISRSDFLEKLCLLPANQSGTLTGRKLQNNHAGRPVNNAKAEKLSSDAPVVLNDDGDIIRKVTKKNNYVEDCTLYVVIRENKTNYRVKIGSYQKKNSKTTYSDESGKDPDDDTAILAFPLWTDLGDLEKGTLVTFDGSKDRSALSLLTESFNETLSIQDLTIALEYQSGSMRLKIVRDEITTVSFPLKAVEASSSGEEDGPSPDDNLNPDKGSVPDDDSAPDEEETIDEIPEPTQTPSAPPVPIGLEPTDTPVPANLPTNTEPLENLPVSNTDPGIKDQNNPEQPEDPTDTPATALTQDLFDFRNLNKPIIINGDDTSIVWTNRSIQKVSITISENQTIDLTDEDDARYINFPKKWSLSREDAETITPGKYEITYYGSGKIILGRESITILEPKADI